MAAKALKQKQREVLSVVARAKNGTTAAKVAKKLGWSESVVQKVVDELGSRYVDVSTGDATILSITELGAAIAANMDAAVRAASLPNR